MIDRRPFIATILERPDKDGPRLVYADWLEEQGESHYAEFIRVGIQAIVPTHQTHPTEVLCEPGKFECDWCKNKGKRKEERKKARLREVELFDYEESDWTFETIHGIPPHWLRGITKIKTTKPYVVWRRGFVDSVTCTTSDWLTHADEILASQPVMAVTLTTWPEDGWSELQASTVMGRQRQYLVAGRSVVVAANGGPVSLLSACWPRVKTWTLPPTRQQFRRADSMAIDGEVFHDQNGNLIDPVDVPTAIG